MADIVPFRRPSPQQKHKGKVLCRNGHHKWRIDKAKQFDVRQGKLVTVSICTRCGERRVKAL